MPAQRAGLFGRSAGYAPAASTEDGSAKNVLETDNDRLVADLERKVGALKAATQGIHDEVSDQNRLLGGMGVDFESAGTMMTTTLRRVEGLLRGGGGQVHICYLVMFTVAVFLLLWWLVGKR